MTTGDKGRKMKRLLFIGPAPQNIGGISIHIRRLVGLVKNNYVIDYIDEGHTRYEGVFNLRSGNVFKYVRKVCTADIVHIHSGIWQTRALHISVCALLLRKKVLVTVHRDPNIEPHTGLTKWLLSRCDFAILVNQEGYNTMKRSGRCKYVLQPAFLPPVMDEEPQLPKGITQWIDGGRGKENSYLMCSNAWNLVMHDGQDLYGLDQCIEAMIKLKNEKGKNYYLIFVVASNTEQQERMANYKKQITENGLSDNILVWEESVSFVRLLQHCDLVLRTTNTDGDAVSIREALYFGKPVLASDVVKRPNGVNLFKTRNVDDLTDKIKQMAIQCDNVDIPQPVDYRTLYCNMYE